MASILNVGGSIGGIIAGIGTLWFIYEKYVYKKPILKYHLSYEADKKIAITVVNHGYNSFYFTDIKNNSNCSFVFPTGIELKKGDSYRFEVSPGKPLEYYTSLYLTNPQNERHRLSKGLINFINEQKNNLENPDEFSIWVNRQKRLTIQEKWDALTFDVKREKYDFQVENAFKDLKAYEISIGYIDR